LSDARIVLFPSPILARKGRSTLRPNFSGLAFYLVKSSRPVGVFPNPKCNANVVPTFWRPFNVAFLFLFFSVLFFLSSFSLFIPSFLFHFLSRFPLLSFTFFSVGLPTL